MCWLRSRHLSYYKDRSKGKTTKEGSLLKDQGDVTAYLLNEAKLAVVLFLRSGLLKTLPGIAECRHMPDKGYRRDDPKIT